MCEANRLSPDVFGDNSQELYYLGELEFDGKLDEIKSRESNRYANFLRDVRKSDIPVSDFKEWHDSKKILTRKYFPGRYEEWKRLIPSRFGFRFKQIVNTAKRLESGE